MKAITIEITKVIVRTFEAESYADACRMVEEDDNDGELADSFFKAECQMKLLDEEELK